MCPKAEVLGDGRGRQRGRYIADGGLDRLRLRPTRQKRMMDRSEFETKRQGKTWTSRGWVGGEPRSSRRVSEGSERQHGCQLGCSGLWLEQGSIGNATGDEHSTLRGF
jgi:hypothetical protein